MDRSDFFCTETDGGLDNGYLLFRKFFGKKNYVTNLSTGEAGAESEIIRCVILDSLNKLQKKVIPAKI